MPESFVGKSLVVEAMTDNEFESYLKVAIPVYAREKMKSNDLSENAALELAHSSFSELLPDGVKTPTHFLFVARDREKNPVGTVWYAVKGDGVSLHGYVYDIVVNEGHRGRGYGEEIMRFLEEEMARKKISAIRLHVFGHNSVARSLYEKLGYKPTSIMMKKELSDG